MLGAVVLSDAFRAMIGVIDYGLGNVQAFLQRYRELGYDAISVRSCNDLENCMGLVLPGVGSFDRAMSRFNSSGLRSRVEYLIEKQHTPILGVCIGMQMMFASSQEGLSSGLGWIDGQVERLSQPNDRCKVRLPHMGWNSVMTVCENPFQLNSDGEEFYFLHSFSAKPKDTDIICYVAEYGQKIVAGVAKDNLYGVQFHPEKSHKSGLTVLNEFARTCYAQV